MDFEQLLRVGFSTFLGQNKIQNFFKNILATVSKSDIKWLLQFYFYFLKKLKKVEKKATTHDLDSSFGRK